MWGGLLPINLSVVPYIYCLQQVRSCECWREQKNPKKNLRDDPINRLPIFGDQQVVLKKTDQKGQENNAKLILFISCFYFKGIRLPTMLASGISEPFAKAVSVYLALRWKLGRAVQWVELRSLLKEVVVSLHRDAGCSNQKVETVSQEDGKFP